MTWARALQDPMRPADCGAREGRGGTCSRCRPRNTSWYNQHTPEGYCTYEQFVMGMTSVCALDANRSYNEWTTKISDTIFVKKVKKRRNQKMTHENMKYLKPSTTYLRAKEGENFSWRAIRLSQQENCEKRARGKARRWFRRRDWIWPLLFPNLSNTCGRVSSWICANQHSHHLNQHCLIRRLYIKQAS